MSNLAAVMGSFEEVEPTADALDGLRELGVPDQDIEILSSLPYSSSILGRPHLKSRLPLISLGSAALGLLVGLFFTVITPYMYIIRVGGQPIVPTPPTVLLLYEFTMLFLILGTFGGMLWLDHLPSYGREYYDPSLTDGRITILVQCPDEKKAAAVEVLRSQGAVEIHEPERREL
jgi:hypothetical protein